MVVVAATLMARANCYDTPSVLCMVAGSSSASGSCQVNCLCPHDSTINQLCFRSYTVTVHWTDSSNHSQMCASGSSTDKCERFHLEKGCSYSKEKIVCPSLSPFPLT